MKRGWTGYKRYDANVPHIIFTAGKFRRTYREVGHSFHNMQRAKGHKGDVYMTNYGPFFH